MTDPTASPVLAGVDVGTTRTKAVLCAPDGTVLGTASRRTPLGEDDAAALRDTALDTLAEALARTGRPPGAVGLTGMAETGVPVDRDGRPTGPLLSWTAPRGTEQADRLTADLGPGPLHATTGVRPSAKAPLATWCWLRDHLPQALRPGHRWAGAVDLVGHALTGTLTTAVTFAQRTMAWDVHHGRWDTDLLAHAGLTPGQPPTVLPAGEPAGTVTAEAARRVPGLGAGTPVLVAGHDHPVGAWAAGVRHPGEVADSLGTAEAVLTLGRRPCDPAAALAQGMGYGRHVDGRHWYVLAGTGNCGALVDGYGGRLLRLPEGPQRHRALRSLLEAAGPGPTGVLVEPYLQGRAAPAPDPARRLSVHGLGPDDGPERFLLALVEATAYQARWMIEAQARLVDQAPRQVTLLGGPVAQPRWLRVKAAVCPWTTRVSAEPHAPAVGAALLAGAAAGISPDQPLPVTAVPAGDPSKTAAYREFYRDRFLPAVRRPTGTPTPATPAHPTPLEPS